MGFSASKASVATFALRGGVPYPNTLLHLNFASQSGGPNNERPLTLFNGQLHLGRGYE